MRAGDGTVSPWATFRSDRIESIQILRGLAAFCVMMHHFAANPNLTGKLSALSEIASYGDRGVYAFFIISGFVIPHAMMRAGYAFLPDARHFFLRRLVRLEPPYIATLIVVILLGYAGSHTPGYRGEPFHADMRTVALHIGYLVPWFGGEMLNPVFWTLAIEFQYYVLMIVFAPLLIGGSFKRQTLFLAATLLLSLMHSSNNLVFKFLPFFGMGFVALLFYHQRQNAVISALWFAAFSALAYCNVNFAAMMFAVVTAGFIFVPLARPISVLTFLGTVSYSLYLLHIPIGDRVINLAARLPSGTWAPWLGLIAAMIVSITAAWLFWLAVERPSIRIATKIG